VWCAILGLTIVVLGAYAIRSGGRVNIEPSRVEISAPPKVEVASAEGNKIDSKQKGSARGEGARAINSLGSINVGVSSVSSPTVQISRSAISQDARANGKGAEAMNALGDANIK
jgi:hypothetical protein